MRASSGAAALCGALATVGCSLLYSADNISGGARGDVDAAPASGCGGSFVFCEDFERGQRDWAPLTSAGGSAVIDTSRPRSASHALHARLPPIGNGGGEVQAYWQRTQPWVQPLYFRIWVWVSSPLQKSATTLLDLNTPVGGTAVFYQGGTGLLAMVSFGAVGEDSMRSTPMPLDRWVCLEEGFDGSNANVWMDGQPMLTLRFPVKNQDVSMALGISYSSAQPGDAAYEAWVDDVVVDVQRVGCGR